MTSESSINVVVTGGGTIAPIDDVRLMTNVSSGRFAAAITEACLDRGARVWHIHTPSAQLPLLRFARLDLAAADFHMELSRLTMLRERWQRQSDRLRLIPLELGTVADYSATLKHVLESQPIDIVFLPMAVSDFEPDPRPGKISSETECLALHCRRVPKVIASVRDWSPAVYLVGFKLLSHASRAELIDRAELSLRDNRADLVVANDLETLRQGQHTIHLVRLGCEPETLEPGADLSSRLVDRVMAWVATSRSVGALPPFATADDQ